MEFSLLDYGSIISTDDTSNRIKADIENTLTNVESLQINAKGIVISTKSARLIFGYLFKKLTKSIFNAKIQFVNASPTFMFAINEGIITELESDSPKKKIKKTILKRDKNLSEI